MANLRADKRKTGHDSVKTPNDNTSKKKIISNEGKEAVRVTRRSSGIEKVGKLKVSLDSDSTSSRDISSKTISSSPYDFMEDSPKTAPLKKSEKVKTDARTVNKSNKSGTKSSKTLPKSKDNSASTKSSKILPKEKESAHSSGKRKTSTVTPKSRLTKPSLKEEEVERHDMEQQKRKRILKSIPPLNLDDISPIIRGRRSNSSAKMEGRKNKEKQDKGCPKVLRKSPRVQTTSVTSSTSFTEPVEESDPNDSALFLSPRKTMPRFSTGKTSTPADLPVKVKSRTTAVQKVSKASHKIKNTSTPNETKPKRDFTHIKENISKLSPVQRTETPTSDYASMDSFMTPSPAPQAKQSQKRRGSSPAFKLEEDDSEENLDLNKSVNKSYKKTKRKYEVSRQNTSKLDEWADRVNSELEDVENFELSVEG